MPKKTVKLINEEHYHVFNRGVDKREIFENESDYMRFYVSLRDFNVVEPVGSLRDVRKKANQKQLHKLVEVKAYCLLPNHFHLLLKQNVDNGISEFLKRIQGGYTSHFNETHKRSGSLLQGTFKRVHINTDEYFNYLFSYINENHTVHGILSERKIYHSSSIHYQNIVRSKVLSQEQNFGPYDVKESIKIAKDIFMRRNQLAKLLFDE